MSSDERTRLASIAAHTQKWYPDGMAFSSSGRGQLIDLNWDKMPAVEKEKCLGINSKNLSMDKKDEVYAFLDASYKKVLEGEMEKRREDRSHSVPEQKYLYPMARAIFKQDLDTRRYDLKEEGGVLIITERNVVAPGPIRFKAPPLPKLDNAPKSKPENKMPSSENKENKPAEKPKPDVKIEEGRVLDQIDQYANRLKKALREEG